MPDDENRRRHERPKSMMGDDQRAKIGAERRKTPAGGSSSAPVYIEDENSEVYSGDDLENIRKRAEIRDRRDTKERVAKVEVKMDAVNNAVAKLEQQLTDGLELVRQDVRADISDLRDNVEKTNENLAKVVTSTASVTGAFEMYIKMNPPRVEHPQRTETSVTEIVRKTVNDQTQTTLAALVLERDSKREDREERTKAEKGKFWDSVWLKVIGGVFGGASGALIVKYVISLIASGGTGK